MINKYLYNSLLFLSLIFLLSACEENTLNVDKSLANDYQYFPLTIGSWVIYDVEDINIDEPSDVFDTSRYQIKEIVVSSFTDETESETFCINRYIKQDLSSLWQIKDVWTAQLINNTAQRVEENIRYVKLSFPLKMNKTWNGNLYNMLDTLNEFNYELTQLHINEVINDISFDSVLMVTQISDTSLIHKDYSIEKYAKNIGLVFKKDIRILSNQSGFDPSVPIELRIKTGTIFTMQIFDYGNNE
ncbi:MAG: hypothetical protein KAG95_05355 [Bacteroidales bacterium]|nr:hypothetical protein [Bacteroidales bacterium]